MSYGAHHPKRNNLDQLGLKEFVALGSINNEISEMCFDSFSEKTQKGEPHNNNNGSAQTVEDEDEANNDLGMKLMEETPSK